MDALLSYCDALDAAAALLVQTIHRFQHFLGHWLILRAASVDISMIPSKADFEAGTSRIRNPESVPAAFTFTKHTREHPGTALPHPDPFQENLTAK